MAQKDPLYKHCQHREGSERVEVRVVGSAEVKAEGSAAARAAGSAAGSEEGSAARLVVVRAGGSVEGWGVGLAAEKGVAG